MLSSRPTKWLQILAKCKPLARPGLKPRKQHALLGLRGSGVQRTMMTVPNTEKTAPFRNLAAPSLDSLPKPPKKTVRPKKTPGGKKKGGSKGKVLLVLLGVGTVGYFYDSYYNARALSRTIKTVYTLTSIAIDYKLNFDESKDIPGLHWRTAEKIYNLMISNKGLYIKMGQALAVQASIFPPEFQRKFAKLFDNAPQDSWSEIRQTFVEEFGKEPSEVFAYIDPKAIASASVAQVHRAQLQSTGEWVAVKVQHADIRKQVEWDLQTYQSMMWIYEKLFDMPIYFISKYIAARMKLEIDFRHEVENSEITRANVEREWGSGDFPDVYVPKVYRELCTERVMVTEWIDGTPLSNKEVIVQNFDVAGVIGTVLTLFSKQVFEWGAVHCDPHPGNVIVRKRRGTSIFAQLFERDEQQVVLIDHGLYVHTSEKFRGEYSHLWQCLFLFDRDGIREIMKSWGIGSEDLFASSVMLRPYSAEETIVTYNGGQTNKELTQYELQQKMRNRMKTFIVDATRMPLELVFLGRTMSLLMGLNRMYGSPVNRIKILAYEASKAFSYYNAIGVIDGTSRGDKGTIYAPVTTLIYLLQAWLDYTRFRLVVVFSDLAFHFFRLGQLFTFNKERKDQKGMEDYLEKQMVGMANKMGFQVEEGKLFNA
ncbi:uncharacterized protein SAPINGB_P001813 [Magnusiomyces paraingens]|uniref:ABC1 atypical kinase-like domain-containing protein n=1 Tax=Magnusiomyces paraingens TaxID=2606893 RepID=A0A5E8BBK9_9ASCO|nr:uncharacterized protein SAPINGB_P001813 [Saprochaete ingens]VVT48508.1 unnamed protein product [Saprochaete ingens]